MKFITSRIISSSQTKSLLDIIKENKQQTEDKKVVTASAKTEEVKTASKVEKPVEKATVVAKTEKPAEVKVEKNYKIKEIVASKKTSSLPKWVFKKVAKLSKMDETFLRQYFSVYYPKDYVEALIAKY